MRRGWWGRPSVAGASVRAPDANAAAGTPALYFPTLDGLRFVAFMLVFVHHLPRASHPALLFVKDYGYVGVCIFLTLSAYLLTVILEAEHRRTGTISVRNFLIRRGLRIWPLYVLFVVAMTAYGFATLNWPRLAVRCAGLLTFTDNVLSGFWGYCRIPCSAHLWTVSLEEQFYLALPFMLATWLRGRRSIVPCLAFLWLAFVAARAASVAARMPYTFIWTSVISGDTILVGVLLALVGWKPTTTGARLSCLGGGLLGLASPAFLPPLQVVGPHQVVLYTTIAAGTGLLLLATLHVPWLAFLGARPLRYLGKISYGLYVFHLLGMKVSHATIERVIGHGWLAHAAGSLAVTMLLAALSYEWLEKPFLGLKARFEVVRTRAP